MTELAAALERKLAAVREARMRAAILREQLERIDDPALYALVAHALRASEALPALREALLGLVLDAGPSAGLPYARRVGLYACARAADDESVMALLRSHERDGEADGAQPAPHVDLRDVPLGTRRSLARRRDRLLLEKLARDPDPVVIANLLANPRTTEDDVVRMAALRPVSATTLLEIGRSARWSRQPRVRAALAHNPGCPVELALQQLHALPLAELREIERSSSLDPALREHARLEARRRGDV
jgi:hypothetical protein